MHLRSIKWSSNATGVRSGGSLVDVRALAVGFARWAGQRPALTAAVFLVILAVVPRLQGLGSSMSLDEAFWADRTLNGDAWLDPKRPLGYVALVWLMGTVHLTEWTLRFPSLVGSLLCVVGSGWIVWRLARNRAVALIALAVLGLNPVLICFAKEAKPYALEAGLHVAVIGIVLAYALEQSRRRFSALIAALLVLPWFATTLVFVLPSAVTAAGLIACRARRWCQLWILAGFALLGMVGLGLLYWSYLGTSEIRGAEWYWGQKYSVFHVGELAREIGYVPWLLQETERAAAWAYSGPDHFILLWQARALLAAHLIGLAVLVMRRHTAAAILWGLPLPIMVGFNAMGLWPMGAFRTNVFVVPYLVVPAILAADALLSALSRLARRYHRHGRNAGNAAAAVITCLVLHQWMPPAADFYQRKTLPIEPFVGTIDGNAKQMLLRIAELAPRLDRGGPLVVVCDPWMAAARRFYLRHHDEVRSRFGAIRPEPSWMCSPWDHRDVWPLLWKVLREHRGAWVTVSAREESGKLALAIERAERSGHLVVRYSERMPGRGLLLFVELP